MHPARAAAPAVGEGASRGPVHRPAAVEYLLTPAGTTEFQVFRSVIEPGGGTGGPYRLGPGTVLALGLSGSTRLVVGGDTRMLSAGAAARTRPGDHRTDRTRRAGDREAVVHGEGDGRVWWQ